MALNYENLVSQGAPEAPNLILSEGEGMKAGIGTRYQDEYNALQQNMYNNAYNFWLWRQQMEYNSPANQVARLKAAGLNPNFNSIDGTGNAGPIPASSGRTLGNIQENRNRQWATAINMASMFAGSIAKGVQALKTFASTPKAINFYRGLLTSMLGNKFEGSRMANWLTEIELFQKSKLSGINPSMYGTNFGDIDYNAPFWVKARGEASLTSAKVVYQNLLNNVKQYEYKYIQPQQLANLKAQWKFITKGTELRQLEINWKDPKEAMGIVRTFLPLLGRMLF